VKVDNQNGELLRLTLKERDAGAAVLGRAFTEYELFRYYFPDETERRAAADRLSFIELSVCLKYGEVYASSEKLEAVAPGCRRGRRLLEAGKLCAPSRSRFLLGLDAKGQAECGLRVDS
jgi:hypothetical protein